MSEGRQPRTGRRCDTREEPPVRASRRGRSSPNAKTAQTRRPSGRRQKCDTCETFTQLSLTKSTEGTLPMGKSLWSKERSFPPSSWAEAR